MELRDYVAALRRYWKTWVGVTLAALFVALVVVLVAAPSYQATATVFVAATSGDGTSGAQFIKQRVTSYPDVARSQAVLGSVIEDMRLTESVAQLRAQVSASNPPDSSQIDITVTDGDPAQAASIANAVAGEFGSTVEQLERPGKGDSPVSLTVTDPANVPSAPVFPQPGLLLGLGLVVGLALGAAAAVLRSRTDARLYTQDDVRAAWGAGAPDLTVLCSPQRQRQRQSRRLTGRPASLVARRLGTPAGDRPIRTLVLGTSPDDDQVARAFAEEVAANLVDGGVPAQVCGSVGSARNQAPSAGVQLVTATPLAPLQEWRRIGREYDGVVLVVEGGRVDRADLQEIRSILTAAEARLLAIVLAPRRRPRVRRQGADAPAEPGRPAATSGQPSKGAALSGR